MKTLGYHLQAYVWRLVRIYSHPADSSHNCYKEGVCCRCLYGIAGMSRWRTGWHRRKKQAQPFALVSPTSPIGMRCTSAPFQDSHVRMKGIF